MNEETPDISTDETALEFILETLSQPDTNFTWAPFTEDRTFIYREPLSDGEFRGEDPQWVHICRPMKLAAAIVSGKKEATVAHSGYARGDECIRCNVSMPASIRDNAQ